MERGRGRVWPKASWTRYSSVTAARMAGPQYTPTPRESSNTLSNML